MLHKRVPTQREPQEKRAGKQIAAMVRKALAQRDRTPAPDPGTTTPAMPSVDQSLPCWTLRMKRYRSS